MKPNPVRPASDDDEDKEEVAPIQEGRDFSQRALDNLNSVLSERRDEILRRHFTDDLT